MADTIFDDIQVGVNVADASFSVTPSRVPLVLAPHVQFEDRVRSYISLSAVLTDFADGSAVGQAAARFFAQDTRPRTLKIGRRRVDSVDIAVDVADDLGDVLAGSVERTKRRLSRLPWVLTVLRRRRRRAGQRARGPAARARF